MRISDWSSDVCSSDLSVCHAMAWRNSRKALKPSLSPRCFINSDARLSASSLEVGESTRKSQLSPSMCTYHWDAGWPASLAMASRSEEHTSELQSLMRISYAVFCLNKNIRNTET